MKNKFTVGLLFTLILIAGKVAVAQDIHFSMYTEAPLLLNPALTGSTSSPYRATLSYRNQWLTVGKAYSTFAGSFDFPLIFEKRKQITKPYLGLGLSFFRDAAGDSKFGQTNIALSASAQVPVAEQHRIAAGFQSAFGQQSASMNNLQWGNQYNGSAYDPLTLSGEANRLSSNMYTDLAYGLYYQFTNTNENFAGEDLIKAYAGYSVYHVNKPELVYFADVTQKIFSKKVFMAGGSIDIPGSKISVAPNFMYLTQGPSKETTFGAMVRFKVAEGTKFTGFNIQKSFSIGAQMRIGDAFIPQVMYQIAGWQFGFSYDMNISELKASSKTVGAFEMAVKYTAPRKNKFTKR